MDSMGTVLFCPQLQFAKERPMDKVVQMQQAGLPD